MKFLTTAAIASSYLFAIKPHKNKHQSNILPKKKIYGHRGIYDNKIIYENTLEAFMKCIDQNIGCELDIRLTADNKVVVFHDSTLKRLGNINKKVKDLTYSELKALPFNVPTLEDVLELVDGRIPIIIEYKTENDAKLLCKLSYKILRRYSGEYIMKSFDYRTLMWFRINHPEISRGLLVSRRFSTLTDILSTTLLINLLARPDYISCRVSDVKRPDIQIFHKVFGGKIMGWTVSDKDDIKNISRSFDSLIFDNNEY